MTDASTSFSYAMPDEQAAPPISVAGSDDQLLARARHSVELGGARAMVASPDALILPIWVELDEEPGATMSDLLTRIDRRAGERGLAAVVAAPRAALDAVAALISSPAVEILIAPSDIERTATAAMLAACARGPAGRAHDTSRDADSKRLRELSGEVARIADALSKLSAESGLAGAVGDRPAKVDSSGSAKVEAGTVRAAIRARRLRDKYFDPALFADPAWDMLLDLFSAELEQTRVPVSSLCIAAAVPPTTALRWIRSMTEAGLFVRRADPHDARRVFLQLSPAASKAMRGYFAAAGAVLA